MYIHVAAQPFIRLSVKLHYIDIDHMLLEGKLIRVSDRKNKKYMIKVGPMWVHFGDRRYQHYKDIDNTRSS
jgi:hypothetical protein